ncbi:MAG: hypothetical protein H6706_24320 [Myxococcales bacterium]|nr:hypothetical protein [Myxococcales bacterium]
MTRRIWRGLAVAALLGGAARAESGLAGVEPEPAATAALLRALEADLLARPFTGRTPWGKGGNFYRTRWCRGAGARDDCQIASGTGDQRDQHAVELYTLFYDQGWPRTFGLGLNALRVPAGSGLGVSVWLHEGGERVVGEGSGVTLRWYAEATGGPTASISVSHQATYRVAETTLSVTRPGTPGESLARLLASPASLRAEGEAQLAALAAEVERALAAGTIQGCTYGPYEGGGIPPTCTRRPLTPAETADARAKLAAWQAEGQKLLATQAEAAHALLADTVPLGPLQGAVSGKP